MPVRDKHHEDVIQALEKNGWSIASDPYTIFLPERRLYIDLLIQSSDGTSRLIEIKTFNNMDSPLNYLANATGQYFLYRTALNLLEDVMPVYLAVPLVIYESFLQESLASHHINLMKINLVVYDVEQKVIIQWIS